MSSGDAYLRQGKAQEPMPEPVEKDDKKDKGTPWEADRSFSWSDPFTWNASLQLAPVAIALLLTFISIYTSHIFFDDPEFDTSTFDACRTTFDYGFRVNAVRTQIERLSKHSWEYGVGSEAILELLDPERTVFGLHPFPAEKVPSLPLRKPKAILWMQWRIKTDNEPTLFRDNYSVSDPASMGPAAVMLGQREPKYFKAALRQKDYLLKNATRYGNGAISHRTEVAELWSDAVSMVSPFLAFYAVAASDLDLMREAVRQCELYREVLMIKEGPKKGLWKHIVGPSEMADEGVWSTGAGWAAFGMVRVRANIAAWRPSNETMAREMQSLDRWIGEILDGAIRTDEDESGLLRNYLGESSWFGETSGTALLAAAAYRMAVLNPATFAQPKYLDWASQKRKAVIQRVDENGLAYPATNPLKHNSREPIRHSAEGESFLLLLGSAWRDCVCAGLCEAGPEPHNKECSAH